jgi:uncharacterized protein (TIGR03086 family)
MLGSVDGALAYAEGVVVGIRNDQRGCRTPCEDFDVEELTTHLVQKVLFFGDVPGGAVDPGAVPEPDMSGGPLVEPLRTAAEQVRSTWRPEHLDENYDLPQGRLSGAELARYFLLEVLGHGWDLAVATGRPADAGVALARAGLEAAHDIGEETLRSPGLMGPAVPLEGETTEMDRFVAYIGRDPQAW